jgi:hypothetical protein
MSDKSPLELVEADLAGHLKGVEWGSKEMATAINRYLGGLLRRGGVGLALSLSPMGADVQALDLPSVMRRLGAVQVLNQEERQDLFRRSWAAAHAAPAPKGAGYQCLAAEVALEAAFRLRRSE